MRERARAAARGARRALADPAAPSPLPPEIPLDPPRPLLARRDRCCARLRRGREAEGDPRRDPVGRAGPERRLLHRPPQGRTGLLADDDVPRAELGAGALAAREALVEREGLADRAQLGGGDRGGDRADQRLDRFALRRLARARRRCTSRRRARRARRTSRSATSSRCTSGQSSAPSAIPLARPTKELLDQPGIVAVAAPGMSRAPPPRGPRPAR